MAAIVMVDRQSIPAPGAATAVLASALTPPIGCVKLVVSVVLATGSVFNVTIGNGSATNSIKLNGGTALTADCLYAFDVFVARHTTDATPLTRAVNFIATTDSIYTHLNVTAFCDPTS